MTFLEVLSAILGWVTISCIHELLTFNVDLLSLLDRFFLSPSMAEFQDEKCHGTVG